MAFSIQNNVAYINGANGIYDGKITDNSVRYGRNSTSNHYSYLEALKGKTTPPENKTSATVNNPGNLLNQKKVEVGAEKVINETDEYIKSLPPLDFEYRYMPEGSDGKNVDKMALLGAAYEEMGQKLSMPLAELNQKLKPAYNEGNAAALDVNKDGQIDIAEYSTSILASDMLSKNPEQLEAKNINGLVNKTGLNTVLTYTNPKNSAAASKSFSDIYNTYNLGDAQKTFVSNPNNTLNFQA